MRLQNAISKELLSHLVLLESEHQGKVLSYIKRLLNKEEILTVEQEMNNRADASERDIAVGRVKKAATFRQDFLRWQKKRRTGLKS